MPYDSVNDLPAQFSRLPDGAKRIAVAVINSVLARGKPEEVAFQSAWAQIKEKYKKVGDRWVKKEESMGELRTVDILGVEIMATGVWKDRNYTREDLDSMAKAFQTLRGKLDPPLKLGHDDQQKVRDASFPQEDGEPAAGWVDNLRRVGRKLVGDFVKVPQKLADLIKAGAYRKRSAEILFDFEVDGVKYPLVLAGVGLLGADLPAVRDIKDITALYKEVFSEELPKGTHVALYEEDSISIVDLLEEAAEKLKGVGVGEAQWKALELVEQLSEWTAAHINKLPDSAFAYIAPGGEKDEEGKTKPRNLRSFPYRDAEGKVDLPHLRNALARVPQSTLPAEAKRKALAQLATEARKAGVGEPELEDLTEVVMEDELRTLLDLKKEDNLVDAVKGLMEKVSSLEKKLAEKHSDNKDDPDPEKDKGEISELRQELLSLKNDAAKRDAEADVAAAVTAGKIAPAIRSEMLSFRLKDPDGFAKVVKKAQAMSFKEEGSDDDQGDLEPSDLEKRLAREAGLKPEDLKEQELSLAMSLPEKGE